MKTIRTSKGLPIFAGSEQEPKMQGAPKMQGVQYHNLLYQPHFQFTVLVSNVKMSLRQWVALSHVLETTWIKEYEIINATGEAYKEVSVQD